MHCCVVAQEQSLEMNTSQNLPILDRMAHALLIAQRAEAPRYRKHQKFYECRLLQLFTPLFCFFLDTAGYYDR